MRVAEIRRIARFRTKEGKTHCGVLRDNSHLTVIDGSVFGGFKLMNRTYKLKEVALLHPVDPRDIVAIGVNYRGHGAETGHETPERPILFLKASTSVLPPEEPIVLPHMTPDMVDYEAELAVVIGKTAKNVAQERALDYVLGYTCGNDVSARDAQWNLDKQWARAKSCDTFCPLGPWIAQGIDPDNLAVKCRLNGETMQDSNTKNMIFNVRHLISYVSHNKTLRPGDVILTGTPEGVGGARNPQVFLKPGDTVEVEIENIGILRNPVRAEHV
jgi:2-keto-4-pentenoate hydratase/2-oxohepta-3-ene-1,7-dioic acid hydratase in catechol pathway